MPYLLLMVVHLSLIRSPDKIQRLEDLSLDRSLQTASAPCDIVMFLIYLYKTKYTQQILQ